jgi:hypothetical protein
MRFLDLFRKKKEEKPVVIEKVPFEELTFWIERNAQTLAKDKEVFTNAVKLRISQLVNELESGIKDLYCINWKKIRTEERIKKIVRENLNNYIFHLQQLKLNLDNLEEVERIKIDNVFENFDKRAGKNYQKSTFLIGKELAIINENVSKLFRDLDNLQEENKTLLDRIEVIFNVKKTLNELENTQNLILEVDSNIEKTHNKIEALQSKIRENNDQVEKIKKSKDFQTWQTKNEYNTHVKYKRDSLIGVLREMIDLKLLAKMWHENKNEMKIVKMYRENFKKAFDEEKGEVLKELITSLDNKDLIHKNMQEIFDIDREVMGITLGKSLTSDLEDSIKKTQGEIESLNAEKTNKVKMIKKLGIEKRKIKEIVKDSLRGIGIEVV